MTWVGGSGDWATPANWSNYNPALGTGGPGPNDDAVIDVAGISVTHSTGAHTVKSLTVNDPFTLSGGTLTVMGNLQAQNGNSVTLGGGTLAGAMVAAGTTITATNDGGNVLSGVTLDGTLDMGSSFAPKMTVTNGLTLNGTILLGSADGSTFCTLTAQGTQTWSGGGSILFGGNSGTYLATSGGTTLTIGAGLTVHGQSGNISGTFINQGTIAADGGGTITVSGISNYSGGTLTGGTWQAIGKSVLQLHGADVTTNAANLVLDGAAAQILDGGTTAALAALAANTSGASLILKDGASLSTPGAFSNQGGLTVGSGSSFNVNGTYTGAGVSVINRASAYFGQAG